MSNTRPQRTGDELQQRIDEQVDKVSSLKQQRASRPEVEEAVKEYLRLCDIQRASSSPSSARLIASMMGISEEKMALAIQEYKPSVAAPVALNRDSSTENVVDTDEKEHSRSSRPSRSPNRRS